MAYRLDLHAPVPDALRAVATERLQHAIDALRTGENAATAVHDARKDIKKTRSLLRLAQPGLSGGQARAEHDALRAAAARLAGARDAEVMAQTVADLAERYAGRIPHAAFDEASDAAAAAGPPAAVKAHEPDGPDGPEPREAAAQGLQDVLARVPDWPLNDCDDATLVAGVERSYRRGRRALADAPAGDAEHLHDWRKRAKDLWYQQRLLHDAWPVVLDAQAEEAHLLTEQLGDHHDLSVLRDALHADAAPAFVARDDVVALIDERREELLGEALTLAARLYAERPSAFARRIRRYLDAPAR